MADTKPRTLWALVSLVCGILGCCGLVAFGLLLSLHQFSDTTGVTVGLWILCLVYPSGVLCLLGVIFGFVALLRIRSGQYGGRGAALTGIILGCLPAALTGIILGCLPLAFALVSFLLSHADRYLIGA
jgi:Domain of unknown function (DUF4190)